MKRGLLTLALLLVSGPFAPLPVRAQQRREAPRAQRRAPRGRQARPGRPAPPRGRRQFRPRAPMPRPRFQPGTRPRVQVPRPGERAQASIRPAPDARPGARPVLAGNAKPRPVVDPRNFVRNWASPPAPTAGADGRPLKASALTRLPSAQNAAVFGDPAAVSGILSDQRHEFQPDHDYWHHGRGFDYVHTYRNGAHWYGFSVGSSYFWSQYRGGRWWSYDPGSQRCVYYNDGYWWWQDPDAPQTVYVYDNDDYVPYGPAPMDGPSTRDFVYETASADSAGSIAPAAPAEPSYHSDVDVPTYSLKPDPDRFALVVGVEEYAALPRADFAARDAAAVRAHLTALGYPDRNVVALTNSQAARASVAKYVESWLAERVTARSTVLVYFSGHGAPDPKTGAAYLMPWDGDAKYLENTGYPLKQLYASLNALPAKNVVVVLDSCFSGAGGRSVLVAGARPLVTNTDVGRGSTGRAVVFSATGTDEITGTIPGQGHGLFTYWFLKGLNGEAAATPDGVTVQALFDYLAPNVEDAARRDNRDQTPQLFAPPDGQRRLLIKDLR